MLKMAFASVLLGISGFANAALITERWQATVEDTNNTIFALGDKVEWAVTFDDTSLIMYEYSDGADDLSNTDDDTISNIYDASCPTGNVCGTYKMASEAIFDFTLLFTQIETTPGIIPNNVNSSRVNQVSLDNTDRMHYWYRVDSFSFDSKHYANGATRTRFEYYAFNQYLDVRLSEATQLLDDNLVSAPEPSTLAIFALGMIGLASRRFKKQS